MLQIPVVIASIVDTPIAILSLPVTSVDPIAVTPIATFRQPVVEVSKAD